MSDLASLPAQMLAPTTALQTQADKATAGIADSQKRSDAATQEKDAALEAEKKAIGEQQGDLKKFSEDHPFPSPNLKPWSEPPPKNDPMESFGSWASTLGILAGVFTKTHLKGSLNASAAAMNAIKKHDWEAYTEAKDAWEKNTKTAIEQAEWEKSAYSAAFELMKTDQSLGLSKLQIAATQADNKIMQEAVRTGNLAKAFEISQGMSTFAAQGPERMLQVQKLGEQVEDNVERTKLYGQWALDNKNAPSELKAQMRTQIMSPQFTINQAKTLAEGQGGITLDPETLKREGADYRITGKMKAWGGGTAGARIRRQIAEESARQAIELGDTVGLQKVRQATLHAEDQALDVATKQRSAVRTFEETAKKNGRVLLGLIDKVDSTGVPVFERWIRGGKKAITGDPDVSAFHAQLISYIPEVAKILSNPNMSGVTSDSARAEASSMIPETVTKGQLERIIPLLEGDFDRRQLSINEEIVRIQDNIASVSNPPGSQIGGAQPGQPRPLAGNNPTAKAGTYENPVTIKTPEEYAKVPSGSYFKDPDGIIRGPKP